VVHTTLIHISLEFYKNISYSLFYNNTKEGRNEGVREGKMKEGREGVSQEGGSQGGKQGKKEEKKKGSKEGGREGGRVRREEWRVEGREGTRCESSVAFLLFRLPSPVNFFRMHSFGDWR